jgi:hypothetical protein
MILNLRETSINEHVQMERIKRNIRIKGDDSIKRIKELNHPIWSWIKRIFRRLL